MYYTRFRGRVDGPFSIEQLRERQRRGQFGRLFQVSIDGQQWDRATQHPELFSAPPPLPPAQSPAASAPVTATGGAAEYTLSEQDFYGESEPEAVIEQPASLASPGLQAQEWTLGDDYEWYYLQNESEVGPIDTQALRFLVSSGRLGPRDYVWRDGLADWLEVRRSPELQDIAVPSAHAAGGTGGQKSTFALGSLVPGILGTSVLLLVGSIGAVILGHLALREIDESGGRLQGRNLAVAGLVLGYAVLAAGALTGIIVLLVSVLRSA